jgi:hypothetical protein
MRLFSFYIVELRIILFTGKEIIVSIRPTRDNSDPVLITTIDAYLGYERTIRGVNHLGALQK